MGGFVNVDVAVSTCVSAYLRVLMSDACQSCWCVSVVRPHLAKLRFAMFNASVYFQDVVSQARAVILAGGTLQPVRKPLPTVDWYVCVSFHFTLWAINFSLSLCLALLTITDHVAPAAYLSSIR